MKGILQGLQKGPYFITTGFKLSVAPYGKALGHSLLLRTAEGIALTAQGEIFYDYCERLMQDQEALENAMNSASGKIHRPKNRIIHQFCRL